MDTIGHLIEMVRSQRVTLEVTPAGRLRYSGPTMSAARIRALRDHRDAIEAVLTLEGRLHLGWMRCETQSDPTLRDLYVDHWIGLLHEYEAACNAPCQVGSEEAA
jgi:hypothetical protein